MKIAIIGAGWYGSHIALELKKKGYDVEIFEKSNRIFNGISGNYGIRLHRGPHYPRSKKTRGICKDNFNEFKALYPELIVDHDFSIYALGIKDAHGYKPKVNAREFDKVCHETKECEEAKSNHPEFKSIQSAYELNEPSIALGQRLRQFFESKLKKAQIPIHLKKTITRIKSDKTGVTLIDGDKKQKRFDYVVNATSYKDLVSSKTKKDFPISLDVTYQACISLMYKDTKPKSKPFSFIVMDGWFPCVMPTVKDKTFDNTYIMTHGCYTIMASSQTPEASQALLDSYTDSFIEEGPKASSEKDMKRYWPDFFKRFKYIGWKGAVLTKPRTKSEFRSAITYEKERVVYIIPGKISNVINCANETLSLIENKQCLTKGSIRFVKNGVLDLARTEIQSHPDKNDRSTVNLNKINVGFKLPSNDSSQISFFSHKDKPTSPEQKPQQEMKLKK